MSVAVMKKLTLFACADDSGDIISRLTRLKCVELSRAESDSDDADMLIPCSFPGERGELEERVSRIEAAIAPLAVYSKRKFSLVKPKLDVDRDEFISDGSYDRAWATVAQVEAVVAAMADAREAAERANEKIYELSPWTGNDIPLDFSGTERTVVIRGAFPDGVSISEVNDALADTYAFAERAESDSRGVYATVFALTENVDKALRVLVSYGFNKTELEAENTTARLAVKNAERVRRDAGNRSARLTEELQKLASEISRLRILCDIEKTRQLELKNHELLARAGSVEMLTGWVPLDKLSAVTAVFEDYACAYEFDDPSENDDTPVVLKNNKFATNFEWVVSLYSLPKYGSFDPTFIMSICYVVLFGMMFADVGYGLVLVLAGFLIPKLLNPSAWANRFFRSFGWCGVSCMFMGVLFGGYFGDFPLAFGRYMLGRAMPETLALVADPVLDSLLFMAIGIAAGAVHLLVGMAINFHVIRKRDGFIEALCEVGTWWLLFAGIALFLTCSKTVGMWVLIAGAAAVFLTGGRHEKKIYMMPVKGLLRFYDLISFASDLLSYSRILALGLTSAVIAQVVNILGTMMGMTVPGIIVMVVAFVLGHLLNIGLNVMGTFVHTARLQYVEFFGKFYEDGGRPFEPAAPVAEHTKS